MKAESDSILDAVDALPPLRVVIQDNDLAARKSLGQNFLLDLNLTRRIARAASPAVDGLSVGTTIEVGPGPGGLTRALLLEGARLVIAVEREERCVEALQPLVQAADGRLEIVHGDALALDFSTLGRQPRRIVANLPYNIATPLLLRWLSHAADFEALCLMFQREVAERITASPGDRSYGRLAVASQWRCAVSHAFDIRPEAFVPAPKVFSSVVQFRPHPRPQFPAEWEWLERVTSAAFGQRRKMLRASLKSLFADPELTLSRLGIEPTARAETLDLEQFCLIARAAEQQVDHS